jgi:hypothetical protein
MSDSSTVQSREMRRRDRIGQPNVIRSEKEDLSFLGQCRGADRQDDGRPPPSAYT